MNFYKINFEEKENDQRNISVGIVRILPVGFTRSDWVISYDSYHEVPLEAGIHWPTRPNRSEIFKMLLVRSEIGNFSPSPSWSTS